jgi:integrase
MKRSPGDGSIVQRGPNVWRLRYRVNGQRFSATVRGNRREALAQMRRRIGAGETGEHVEPRKMTLSELLDQWHRDWAAGNVGAKTFETYAHHLKHLRRHIGERSLQKLQTADFVELYARLLRDGLAPRTVTHVRRLAHQVLSYAVQLGLLHQAPTAGLKPPRVVSNTEIEILRPEQIRAVLDRLAGTTMGMIVSLAIATGLRRGEILALRWRDIDLDGAELRVERAVEQTLAKGVVLKPPKTRHGRRTISLPSTVIVDLRAHWRAQQEQRMALGRGKGGLDDLVFPRWNGTLRSPNALSQQWKVAVRKLGFRASFHSLRHTHASHLIARGVDVLTISRRLGHASPSITLNVYGHLMPSTDAKAASIMESFLKSGE